MRILLAVLLHALDFRPPGNILFFTGDQDFSILMAELARRGFVILVANDNRQALLDLEARASWDFYRLCEGGSYRTINAGPNEEYFEDLEE